MISEPNPWGPEGDTLPQPRSGLVSGLGGDPCRDAQPESQVMRSSQLAAQEQKVPSSQRTTKRRRTTTPADRMTPGKDEWDPQATEGIQRLHAGSHASRSPDDVETLDNQRETSGLHVFQDQLPRRTEPVENGSAGRRKLAVLLLAARPHPGRRCRGAPRTKASVCK